MCDCSLCLRIKRIEEIKTGNDVEKMRELISELHNLVLNLESDNDRYAAIFNGQWPNSEEMLKASLNSIGAKA